MSEEYLLIPLTRGQFAKVSPEDYENLSRHKWTAHIGKGKSTFYAVRIGPRENGKRPRIAMHREVLGLSPGDKRQPDHINLDGLDNRRSNLRIATVSENCRNRKTRSDNKSGFKGVYPSKGRWCAQITIHGDQRFLGSFGSPEEAHAAYVAEVEKFHGEFARSK